MKRIVIVDDDVILCHFLKKALAKRGYDVTECYRGKDALKMMDKDGAALILLDNRMPDISGIDLLGEIKEKYPEIPIIIMTAFGSSETAIEAMRFGAFDYIMKPFELEEILELVEKALKVCGVKEEKAGIQVFSDHSIGTDQMIGKSVAMQEVYKIIGQVADTDVTVLIQGESGTGKELVARAIYKYSRRKDKPFLAINCAAIPESLLESELFGYERGAFTGAERRYVGKFEQCNEGTIFLDEVGDMALSTQAKILRVLQEGEFVRVGGKETIRVDVRILASTHKRLDELVRQGKFREDLYYRLKIINIMMPPLRERREDIEDLAIYFFQKYRQQLNKEIFYIDPSVFRKLQSYHWPGNVRELENTIKRAIILCKGNLLTEEEVFFDTEKDKNLFPTDEELENLLLKKLTPVFSDIIQFGRQRDLYTNLLTKIERFLIQKALSETQGNQVKASRLLGISRNTLRNRMIRYGVKFNPGRSVENES